MALIVAADVTARLSDQAYKRLFAKSGGSTADTTFRDLCISEANSRAAMLLEPAFPDGLDAAGGTVDEGVKGLVVDLCCGLAAARHPSATDTAGWVKAMKDAEAMLRALKRDELRPVTSAAGRARARARYRGHEDAAGNPTNVFGRVRDGTDGSTF